MDWKAAQSKVIQIGETVIQKAAKLTRLWRLTFSSYAVGSSMAKLPGGLALPALLEPLRGAAVGSVHRRYRTLLCGIVSK